MERFVTQGSVAVTSDETMINLFNPAATPTMRGRIYDFIIGCGAAVADATTIFMVNRTTAVGTEGSGFTPNNLDSGGPAGAYDSGVGTFSAEPTYTANKQLWRGAVHQRNTVRWVAREGSELVMAATQNNGAGLRAVTSTTTVAYDSCIYFME